MTQTIPSEIFNAQKDAIEKLAAVFPSVVKDGSVDFELLKRELDGSIDDSIEKYRFTWTGKENARKIANEDVFGRTLRFVPDESKNADTTGNLFIEGDNLEVLKLLRQNYYAAIKMIYIDPPYNTGNDFVYRDNFTKDERESELEEGNVTEDGQRLVRNQRSSNRFHANWLNMIYPRLRVARDLLTEDGVIFISIDDNEVANLRKLCDEIFGEANFISQFTWRKKKGGGNDANLVAIEHEYILFYARDKTVIPPLFYEYEAEYLTRYKEEDETGKFFWDTFKRKSGKQYYPIKCPDGTFLENDDDGNPISWLRSEPRFLEDLKNGEVRFQKYENHWSVQFKQRLPEGKKPRSLLTENGVTGDGSAEILGLFGKNMFENPKPVELVKHFVSFLPTSEEYTILDFFSGSCTTAHAVMALNAEDGGQRKFIMVQIPEKCDEKSEAFKAGYKTIADIGKERIRRAGERILCTTETQRAQRGGNEKNLLGDLCASVVKQEIDTGFKVFKTDDTMIRWTHAMLTDDRSVMNESFQLKAGDKDGVDFMPHFTDIDVAYEILLRQHDIPLSAKMEHLSKIDKRTWCFADRYVVCLEEKITVKLLEKLAEIDPVPFKYVFRDSAFGDDIALKDETIRRLAALVAKATGETKKVYTVEFL